MSQSLQDTVENFKCVIEEMQKKVGAMRERAEDAYRKLSQLEVQKYSLIDTNNQLNQELRKLSYEVARFEDHKAMMEGNQQAPQKKGTAVPKKVVKRADGSPKGVDSTEKTK